MTTPSPPRPLAERTAAHLRNDLRDTQAENERLCRQMRMMWAYIERLERRAGVEAGDRRLDHEQAGGTGA